MLDGLLLIAGPVGKVLSVTIEQDGIVARNEGDDLLGLGVQGGGDLPNS